MKFKILLNHLVLHLPVTFTKCLWGLVFLKFHVNCSRISSYIVYTELADFATFIVELSKDKLLINVHWNSSFCNVYEGMVMDGIKLLNGEVLRHVCITGSSLNFRKSDIESISTSMINSYTEFEIFSFLYAVASLLSSWNSNHNILNYTLGTLFWESLY